MGYIIRMPQMGMEMDQGEVVSWELPEDEAAEEDDIIAIVESEKTTNEVAAREDGVIRRIIVEEGGKVEPGVPIGIFAAPDEDLSKFEDQIDVSLDGADDESGAETTAKARATTGMSEPAGQSEDVRASPGARKLAGRESVDLTAVDGTGPGGAISEEDVERFLDTEADERSEQSGGTAATESVRASPGARKAATEAGVDLSAVDGTGPGGAISEEDVDQYLESEGADGGSTAGRTISQRRKLSGVQQTISDRLSESYRDAVHVTLNRSFDAEALRDVSAAAETAGVDVSISDLLLAGVGAQLEANPEFNALFEDGEHRLVEEVNIGVAVDAEAGLLTPVVPSVSDKSVEAVAEVRRTLTERVLSGEFTGDDLSGGTFTISNLGMFGIDDFDPIINPPEISIGSAYAPPRRERPRPPPSQPPRASGGCGSSTRDPPVSRRVRSPV